MVQWSTGVWCTGKGSRASGGVGIGQRKLASDRPGQGTGQGLLMTVHVYIPAKRATSTATK
eukprot:808532-Rhodomonas_salina.1